MSLVEIDDLTVAYGATTVVEGLGLRAEAGRVTAVVGPSGSGKTTVAQAVLGLLPEGGRILRGSIRLDGDELTTLSERAWRSVRGRRIGLVPQDPGVSLDPVMPVGRQVDGVLRTHRLPRGRAVELLAAAGMPEPELRARQYPHELSGGMRQRALIAVGTAAEPRLLVADEPTSALDATVARRVLDRLTALVRESGTALLLITHDLGIVADRADDVVVVDRGRVAEAGPVDEVLRAPRTEPTRILLRDSPATRVVPPRPPVDDRAPLLQVTGLRRAFRARLAVDDVSFTVPRGTTLGLVGESGSGKTTTARLVLGLDRPDAGSVRLDGVEVATASRAGLRALHRRMQMVYQNPYSSLHPRFTVEELVTEPLRNAGLDDRPRRVRALLDDVGLPADVVARRAGELSGGQRQRVAIARALAVGPELLVCDEPVSALDVSAAARVLDLLTDLQREHGLTYLFISHDLGVVRQVSDTIAVMRGGRVVESGPADRLFTAPRHEYTRALLAAVPGRTPSREDTWSSA